MTFKQPWVNALNSGSVLNTENKLRYTMISHFAALGRITHCSLSPLYKLMGHLAAHFRNLVYFWNLVHLPFLAIYFYCSHYYMQISGIVIGKKILTTLKFEGFD